MQEFLGGIKVRVETEIAERTKRPGVAVGLAWTPAGGDILFIEANKMKGKGGFTMTGQIGEVMQESMQAALTWVRSNAALLGLEEDFTRRDRSAHPRACGSDSERRTFGRRDDGDGAGFAADGHSGSSADRDDRRNHVERECAAGRRHQGEIPGGQAGGCGDIILPADNRQNVEEDLTPEQIEGVKIHYAKRIEDVLAVALPQSISEVRKDEEIRETTLSHADA